MVHSPLCGQSLNADLIDDTKTIEWSITYVDNDEVSIALFEWLVLVNFMKHIK